MVKRGHLYAGAINQYHVVVGERRGACQLIYWVSSHVFDKCEWGN